MAGAGVLQFTFSGRSHSRALGCILQVQVDAFPFHLGNGHTLQAPWTGFVRKGELQNCQRGFQKVLL